jgi:putative hydroxymethylpyrimidine transport system ATP-binding protein
MHWDDSTFSGLEVQSAALDYGCQTLFSGLNFKVPAGAWMAILGASGVGKTSLLRLVAGLHQQRPQAKTEVRGRIMWQGQTHFRVAYMAQQDGLLPWASILDNVLLPFHLQGVACPEARAKQLLQDVGLSQVMGKFPGHLSGGMRQRVALVRTLLQNAPIVLMDEPFSALDAITRLEVQELASRLLRSANATVLMVTHDPLEALRLADQIKVLQGVPALLHDYQWQKKDDWQTGYEALLALLRGGA